MAESQDYNLFTTTRYDEGLAELSWNNDGGEPSSFLLLPYHFQRLANATRDHKWPEAQKTLQTYGDFKSVCIKTIDDYKASNNTEGKAIRVSFPRILRVGYLNPVSATVANCNRPPGGFPSHLCTSTTLCCRPQSSGTRGPPYQPTE